ncbi:hypothetical protein DUNSADRAFT_11608 [Dunaliella salina]|uniref:Uncharacterized protein n=1 Tax=Dunaliella salina TaxID=3046 RepID=A0ABQ7FRW4_DUNSA|nr:hypothetical protein DUNSADRAFT_11608 [Dunaliella salina]|eukprot:KAF5825328.1 hypothetical protein DUNSADRAFT_11608 [Dunaliella salina]
MLDDGYLLPPFEMPEAESIRMTLLNILRWFDNYGYLNSSGKKLVIVYDDMCHLLRYAIKRQHLHPGIEAFVKEAEHCVDRFHFVHNHKGVWCDLNVNPFTMEELKGVNTEICEQRFK